MVAPGYVGGHIVVVHVEHLLAPPLRPLLVTCGHVDLYWSFREDDGTDVASFDHPRAVDLGPFPLAADKLSAHPGVGGDDAHGPSDLGAAHLYGGVDPVDEDPVGHF